jgi:recombination DNA repair RAD52 pathway protein
MSDTTTEEAAPITSRNRGITDEQIEVLLRPLHPGRVSTRTQGGTTLSYVEAHDVKATLSRVFGFGGFDAEVIDTKVLSITSVEKGGKDQWTVLATSTVRLTIHATGAVYAETAAASQVGPQVGEVCDFAIKTASSDALKRCAIYLGTQFGLSLYAGTTKDVVKAIFAPDQWTEYVPPAPPSPEVQAMLDRATTVEAVSS